MPGRQPPFWEQSAQLDTAVWMALRSLEGKVALARELANRAEARDSMLNRGKYLHQAEEALRAAALIRSGLDAGLSASGETEEKRA